MIIYDLRCEPGQHAFEGWFASAQDFAEQIQRQLVRCPVCNSETVRKVPAASHIQTPVPRAGRQEAPHRLLAEWLEQVTRHSEDVGQQFTDEARKIHYQEAPARTIRGTATRAEVRELLDEGIPVLPLPGKSTNLN